MSTPIANLRAFAFWSLTALSVLLTGCAIETGSEDDFGSEAPSPTKTKSNTGTGGSAGAKNGATGTGGAGKGGASSAGGTAGALCTPTTCALSGATCGSLADGCGHELQCGTCGLGQTCSDNVCSCDPALLGPNPDHPLYDAFLATYPASAMPKTIDAINVFDPAANGQKMTWSKINPGHEFVDDSVGGVLEANIIKGRDLSRQYAEGTLPAGAKVVHVKDSSVFVESQSEGADNCAGNAGIGWGWGSLLFQAADQSFSEIIYLYIGYCGNGDTEAFYNSVTPAVVCGPIATPGPK